MQYIVNGPSRLFEVDFGTNQKCVFKGTKHSTDRYWS